MKKKTILFCLLIAFSISFAQVGVGNTNPAVNLDARAATGNSAIAFGNTNQTAPVAGGGAMKYDTGQLFYSNGTTWIPLLEKQVGVFIPRVVASRKKTDIQTMGPTNTNESYVWTFQDGVIDDGNWDITANGYTIPTTGFYQISLFGKIGVNLTNNSSNWTIFVFDGAVENRYIVATQNILTAGGTLATGGTLTLYLTTGQVVKLGSAHCDGCGSVKTYTVSPDASFTVTQLSNS
jgi:hypothetical protein